MSQKLIINLSEDQITEGLRGISPPVPQELIQACIENYVPEEWTPDEFVRQIFDIMVEMRDILPLTDYSTLHNLRRQILLAMVGIDPSLQKAVNGCCNRIQVA